MKNYSIRLTDQQFTIIKELANLEGKSPGKITRELLDLALQKRISKDRKTHYVSSVPRFEIVSASASVEALILLRKLAENSAPELVIIAQNEAKEMLDKINLMELVSPSKLD